MKNLKKLSALLLALALLLGAASAFAEGTWTLTCPNGAPALSVATLAAARPDDFTFIAADTIPAAFASAQADFIIAPVNAGAKLFKGAGCQRCNRSGYKGRKGIFEIFRLDDEIQQMIFDNRPARDLRARAREMGMRTLREDGVRKVLAGITTVSEVLRVTMGDEN